MDTHELTDLTELLQQTAPALRAQSEQLLDGDAFAAGLDLRIRDTSGRAPTRESLVSELCAQTSAATTRSAATQVIHEFQAREQLRIAAGQAQMGHRLETATIQLSNLADATCQAALDFCWQALTVKFGNPLNTKGRPARFAIVALDNLGGEEQSFSPEISLFFLSDEDGRTDGSVPKTCLSFFDQLASDIVDLLADDADTGTSYHVSTPLKPPGAGELLVCSPDAVLKQFELRGRSWQRQALTRARVIAGDTEFGQQFLHRAQSWVYGRYLNAAEIEEIKSLKRRIEQRAMRAGGDQRNLLDGMGGLRDIQFVIQFLQLLNGGDLERVRTSNTLEAIARLEQVGCLTMQERSILEQNYSFLQSLLLTIQRHLGPQVESMPKESGRLDALAEVFDAAELVASDGSTAGELLAAKHSEVWQVNRRILDHILHSAFGNERVEPEVDLIMDPNPDPEDVVKTLVKYDFQNCNEAYQHITNLATERIPFLSSRRCRHFLASIAPKLLTAAAKTPDPDRTLRTLSEVSDAIGGKGVLWELFQASEASLNLYVQLCANSPYLSGILTNYPGMIDELLDSLLLDKLPTREDCELQLDELCRGAQDLEPILASFKNSQHLRIGVRDILEKHGIEATHAALSDVAEAIISRIANFEFQRLSAKHGLPKSVDASGQQIDCEFTILAMGKVGAREPNYHSHLDLMFLYEAEGNTDATAVAGRASSTSNQHFFTQLAQRIVVALTKLNPTGPLYHVDTELRPTGKNGPLAATFGDFAKHFESGASPLWGRQSLCKARPIFGSVRVRESARTHIRQAITVIPWSPGIAHEMRAIRLESQMAASDRNLKQGAGGTRDVESYVELLQLKHAAENPAILQTGTLNSLDALHEAGFVSDADAKNLHQSYRFLRLVESRLRLMNTAARHDLPESAEGLRALASFLGYVQQDELLADCQQYRSQNRSCFNRLVADS